MKETCNLRYGEVLKMIRIVKDSTINDLAEKIGVCGTYISEIETYKRNPSFAMLEKYAEGCGISISTIIKLGEMFEQRVCDNTKTRRKLNFFWFIIN